MLEPGDIVLTLGAGDALYIHANAVHQFVNAAETPLKFLCLVPTRFPVGFGPRWML